MSVIHHFAWMTNTATPVLFWFRRDLRIEDNCGLYHALSSGSPVIACFIFDQNILDRLSDSNDARVSFIHQSVTTLKDEIRNRGGELIVRYGLPEVEIPKIVIQYKCNTVFANHDDEPYSRQRDGFIRNWCMETNTGFKTFKDHLIFERNEVLKPDGRPYTVFTPYSKSWKTHLMSGVAQTGAFPSSLNSFPSEEISTWKKTSLSPVPTLEEMGFTQAYMEISNETCSDSLLINYHQTRDIPSVEGTSRLGIHLRFGTASIRKVAQRAYLTNEVFLNELIWRDFYAMILFHFPHVVESPFRRAYEHINWRNDEIEFERWCQGQTGYPLVDAGMRQLSQTGWMHNRVRMVTASFLSKHLLIDWRWGEAWFARKLLDFDLASNNGGWQWAAGCGTDAAPYFRIFNPSAQQQRFDPDLTYIKKWIKEYHSPEYPLPIVDHAFARKRCLDVYQSGITGQK